MKQTRLQHLYTTEGKALTNPPWTAYPRPQLRRDSYLCLNGEWSISINEGAKETIRVPFAPESLLSGIHRSVGKRSFLIYKKSFVFPDSFVKDRVLLHFGAVDQSAVVYVNGEYVGLHKGGYNSFSFDITDFISNTGENLMSVTVMDNSSDKSYPYGKQRVKRGGMWYTPVSGIWQTVWIESVPESYVHRLRITPYIDRAEIVAEGIESGELKVNTPNGEMTVSLENGHATVRPNSVINWSPEHPYLYEFTLSSGEDTVHSYFALRTLETKTVNGIPRLCLNGKPYFFHGLLDQGYFSDGIYTPAAPECLENDVLTAKELGFNTLRKHIKIEPELFYYYCDKHGMIVFQDMVNNGSYSFIRDTALPTLFMKSFPDKLLNMKKRTRETFIRCMLETAEQLYNHPCICYWTIFNEGWGQFDASNVYDKLKAMDNTRFIDTASGWYHPKRSDVESEHVYFKSFKPKKTNKPLVLSEFGGYVYKLKENSFNPDRTYGYKHFETREAFEDALVTLYEKEIIPAVKDGLCGAILTQLTDVEDETNGLITYDRKTVKVANARMIAIAEKLKESAQ